MSTRYRNALTVAAVLVISACSATPDGSDAATDESGTSGVLEELADKQRQAQADLAAQITVIGGLELAPTASLAWADDDCIAISPDTDLMERVEELNNGPQVRVLDASGDIVGTAQIRTTVTDEGACNFSFETTVPPGGNFYTVEVASFVTDAISESEARGQELVFDLKDAL